MIPYINMKNKKDMNLLQRLKEAFEAVPSDDASEKYPENALPIGTYARSKRLNRLGVITDAFYGGLDEDNKKIIVYTILIFPTLDPLTRMPKENGQYYVTNEYEYEIIAYLMMNPMDLSNLMNDIGGGMIL
jgi:hypothetical protein